MGEAEQQAVRQWAEKGEKVGKEWTSKEMEAVSRSHISKIGEQLEAMATGSTSEAAREAFVTLSENMILVGNQMKEMDKKLYVQHCPMADNNKGANWLSLEKEIRNPYYGNAMLTCGSVVSVIN